MREQIFEEMKRIIPAGLIFMNPVDYISISMEEFNNHFIESGL
jgi:hypothetical protein